MLNNEISETQRVTPNVEEAKQLLSNTLLNRITKTNVYGYYTVYTLLISYFIYSGLNHISWYGFMAALMVGAMIWSLIEYLVHRYIFHWQSSHPAIKIITFMFHGVHHAYPRDVPRSITPLIFTLPLAVIFFYLFKSIFGTYVDGVFVGFILGYVLYSIVHDSTHHFAMNYPVLKQLKKNHMRHHYFDTSLNFGVSSPLWDILFKSYVKSHSNKTVQNIKD